MAKRLQGMSHQVVHLGAQVLNREDDYLDFLLPLAKAVAEGNVDRGVAICGVGASVGANKIAGARPQ